MFLVRVLNIKSNATHAPGAFWTIDGSIWVTLLFVGPWIVDTIRFFSVIYMETIRSFAALLVQSTNYYTKRHTDNNKLVAQLEWHRQDNLNQNISVVFLFMFLFSSLIWLFIGATVCKWNGRWLFFCFETVKNDFFPPLRIMNDTSFRKLDILL